MQSPRPVSAVASDPTPAGSARLGPAHQGRRLIDAAHQFEASLMQELLAPLTRDPLSGSDATGDGQDEDEGSMQALSGFAGSSMARAISEHGGFGIARLLLDRLGPEGPRRP